MVRSLDAFGTYKDVRHVNVVKYFWNVSSNIHKSCKVLFILATAFLSKMLRRSGLQRNILLQSMGVIPDYRVNKHKIIQIQKVIVFKLWTEKQRFPISGHFQLADPLVLHRWYPLIGVSIVDRFCSSSMIRLSPILSQRLSSNKFTDKTSNFA